MDYFFFVALVFIWIQLNSSAAHAAKQRNEIIRLLKGEKADVAL